MSVECNSLALAVFVRLPPLLLLSHTTAAHHSIYRKLLGLVITNSLDLATRVYLKHVRLLLQKLAHFILFELEVITEGVARSSLELEDALFVVELPMVIDNRPEDFPDDFLATDERLSDQLEVFVGFEVYHFVKLQVGP